MMTIPLSINNHAQKLAVYAYFLSILLLTQIDNTVTTALYYLSSLACVAAFKAAVPRLRPAVGLLLAGTLVLGALNVVFIGNLNVVLLGILLLAFYLAQLFLDERVSPGVFLHIVWIYAAVILVLILVKGLGEPVFSYVSNNYISVYLLSPLVLYYIKCEREGQRIRLLPAIVVWGLCLLGTSRAGLLVASVLLLGLLVYRYFLRLDSARKLMLFGAAVLFVLLAVLIVLPLFADRLADNYIINRFSSMGLKSESRLHIWGDYLVLWKDPKYLLLGAPQDLAYWSATHFNGDLHNSYLYVHSYLGLFGFAGMLVLMAKSFFFAWKNKNWVFLIMFITFGLRAFTDHVFGSNRLSAVFLCFLLYPFLYGKKARRTGPVIAEREDHEQS